MNKTFTISFNQDLAKVVQQEMKRGRFGNTSEFFRHLVRHNFVSKSPMIEVISSDNPDSVESKKAIKTEKFIPLKVARKSLGL